MEVFMGINKTDLINIVAENAGMKKVDAEKAIKATMGAITAELAQHGKVTLVGFGTFGVSHRQQRKGRSPKTGAEITIPAKIVPKFKPGKALHAVVGAVKTKKKAAPKGKK
jgi:DNA-binding protein HU-beta